jgi:hypothetical protein
MKDKLNTLARIAVFAVAIFQLAISQIHIKVITKVSDTEIGFVLFLFIIFGLVNAFNAVQKKKSKFMILDILALGISSYTGYYYVTTILANIGDDQLMVFADIQWSLLVSLIAMATYIVGTVTIYLTKEK